MKALRWLMAAALTPGRLSPAAGPLAVGLRSTLGLATLKRLLGLAFMSIGVALISNFGQAAVQLQAARFQAQASQVIPMPDQWAELEFVERPSAPGLALQPTSSSESSAENEAAREKAESTATGSLSGGGAAVRMPAATWMRIPSIGVDSKVVELNVVKKDGRWVWETPKFAVGHHRGTANAGEVGNAVFSGHISSPLTREGSVFRRLPELEVGAEVIVESPAGTFVYRVVSTAVVEPLQVEVMGPTPDQTLTLITCYPDLVYSHRFVVTAKRVDAGSSESPS